MAKTDLIKTIDHQKSITKGLLSNSLMIDNIAQNGSYNNNWSPQINHKSNIVKISNVIILSQKTNIQKGDNLPAKQFFFTYDWWYAQK